MLALVLWLLAAGCSLWQGEPSLSREEAEAGIRAVLEGTSEQLAGAGRMEPFDGREHCPPTGATRSVLGIHLRAVDPGDRRVLIADVAELWRRSAAEWLPDREIEVSSDAGGSTISFDGVEVYIALRGEQTELIVSGATECYS